MIRYDKPKQRAELVPLLSHFCNFIPCHRAGPISLYCCRTPSHRCAEGGACSSPAPYLQFHSLPQSRPYQFILLLHALSPLCRGLNDPGRYSLFLLGASTTTCPSNTKTTRNARQRNPRTQHNSLPKRQKDNEGRSSMRPAKTQHLNLPKQDRKHILNGYVQAWQAHTQHSAHALFRVQSAHTVLVLVSVASTHTHTHSTCLR
jgi:mRNA-degrading endonuclease YafQ of YafQ-DinJ toxin-antitoxin module